MTGVFEEGVCLEGRGVVGGGTSIKAVRAKKENNTPSYTQNTVNNTNWGKTGLVV